MREVIPKVILAPLLAAMVLVAAPTAAPQTDPKAGFPKNYETYGREQSVAMIKACMKAGEGRFEPSSLQKYCACNVYVLEEVATKQEFDGLSPDERKEVLDEIANTCKKVGFAPVPIKAQPQRKPQPSFNDPVPLTDVAWSVPFKTEQKEHVWMQLMRRGFPSAAADALAGCMIDKAEKEYPNEKDFDAYIHDGKPDDGMADRHARECIEKFQAPRKPAQQVPVVET